MEKHHYDFALKLEDSSNVHRIEMEMIPRGSFVLDAGCHTGIMGELLRSRKECKVIGIDSDVKALDLARERLQSVFFLDLEKSDWSDHLSKEGFHNFDIILFGDVLEHTSAPERILTEAKKLLRSGGRVIVSVPNVAHWRVRFSLLFGKFDYTEAGILDRTHLRFFTRRSARQLVENSGYRITKYDVAGYDLPHWLLRLFPGLLSIQIVFCAEPE